MQREKHWLRNNILPILLVTVLLSVVVFSLASKRSDTSHLGENTQSMAELIRQNLYDHQVVPLQIGDQRLWVEVVTTPAGITQGLSGRADIGSAPKGSELPTSPSQGMLFVFEEPRVPTFWMKEMQFDLDMVWIDDGTIVEITENVPKPEPGQTNLPVYSPRQAVNMVLELPAGSVEAWQLEIGETLIIPTLLSDQPSQK